MPLVRLQLKNEYSLGVPELYKQANAEDPKGILEGVAVAGLVGVLRQLGDLAEFAGEVFHGLQEQVTATTSRSHQLISRVKRLESALPPLEKAVLGQRSRLHFAYTAGCTWRTQFQFEKNHFVNSDVPKSIMDSYEDCRGPPNLHLLDRFDPGGPGSCLKRYSDPTFFKRSSMASDDSSSKILKNKMDRKIKRRRPRPRSGDVPRNASFSYSNGRMQFPQFNIGRRSPSFPAASSCDASQSSSVGQQSKFGYDSPGSFRGKFSPDYLGQPEGQDYREHISSPVKKSDAAFIDFNPVIEKITGSDDNVKITVSLERVGRSSDSIRWNEKTEPFEQRIQEPEKYDIALEHESSGQFKSLSENVDVENADDSISDLQTRKMDRPSTEKIFDGSVSSETIEAVHGHSFIEAMRPLEKLDVHVDGIESETDHFLDALNAIESEIETELGSEKMKMAECHLEEKQMDEVSRHNMECRSSAPEPSMPLPFSGVRDKDDGLLYQSQSIPQENICASDAATPKDANNYLVETTLQSPQIGGLSYYENGGNTPKSDLCSAVSSSGDDNSEMLLNHGRSSTAPNECKAGSSTSSSATFWSNGSLLGLQPSKPPDFKVATAQTPSVNHLSHKDAVEAVNQDKLQNGDNDVDMDDSRWKPTWKISPDDLDVKCSDRLISFGSTEKVFPSDREAGLADHQTASFLQHMNNLTLPGRAFSGQSKDQVGGNSPLISPSASPPLQFMKISFQPMDVNSKLKLKFPHGSTDGERGCDYFPSFQLVPEVLVKQENLGSDSDADTFTGSSCSESEEHHIDHNDLLSDCESNDSCSGKECDPRDSFQRISLAETGSTAPENGRIHHQDIEEIYGQQNSESSGSSIQKLDAVGDSFREEPRTETTSNNLLHPEAASTPAPSPVPPVQWRSIRPLIDALEQKCQSLTEGSYSTPTVSPSKPAPTKNDLTDITNSPTIKRSSSQKSDPERESPQEKSTNENVFLRQIRTKSLNLRRTVKTVESSATPINVHGNVLLKKAHAIREAVGSDADDDGGWSET